MPRFPPCRPVSRDLRRGGSDPGSRRRAARARARVRDAQPAGPGRPQLAEAQASPAGGNRRPARGSDMSRTATAATASETLERLGDPPEWLGAIGDPAAVEGALLPHIPGLRSCEVVRVRTKSTGMGAVYLADVAGAGAVELHGRVSAPRPPAGTSVAEPGWRRYLPDLRLVVARGDADAALPALGSMTDPDAAARMIERLLQASGRCPGMRVSACRPRVMRHKPGSRCTVAYELDLAPDAPAEWPRAVVAKTYWGGKGRIAWDGMRDLWRAPVASAG